MFTVPAAIRRSTTPPLEAPIFDGAIPLLTATEGVEDLNMYDASTHYTTGGAVETYSLVNAPGWLTIGASTGIIGGTPPSDTNVISAYVIGTNAVDSDNSNTFNVDVSAAGNPDAFIYTWETTTDNFELQLPAYFTGTYNASVDWGDGHQSTVLDDADAGCFHTYATAGTYTVTITGTFTAVRFNSVAVARVALRTVEQLGDLGYITFQEAFRNCAGLTSFTAGPCDTSGATNMYRMFNNLQQGAGVLTTFDVTDLDTNSATDMREMFKFTKVDIDASGFNISSLTTATQMFTSSLLSDANYDALLVAWAAQAPSINSGVTFDGGPAQYTETASRLVLTDTYTWSITDGGPA